jgi:hypothetical protein
MDTEYTKSLMYIAGMLSDVQELLGEELNGEDNEGWVAPRNAEMATKVLNNAKKLIFAKMEEEKEIA